MSESESSSGIGFTGALLILFIALKLTHVIDWSWWWVLSPAWIGAAIMLITIIVILIVELRADRKRHAAVMEAERRRRARVEQQRQNRQA